MYLYHFGLRELPFTLTPNTQFYVDLEGHHEATQVLTTALMMGEGFIKVVGEVGLGKTLICRKLLNELPEHFISAYVPDPYLTPAELRLALATELGLVTTDQQINQQQLMQMLQQHLFDLCQKGKSVVVLIDEAQALPFKTLEAIRLLTNLETENRKLVQVVLFGQTELDSHLARHDLRQLRQRIAFSYQLSAMKSAEVAEYIRTRLEFAGDKKSKKLFSNDAIELVSSVSTGIPRVINILCHKALMLAFGEGAQKVDIKHVQAAVKDTNDVELPPETQSPWRLVAAVLLVVLATGAWFFKDNLI